MSKNGSVTFFFDNNLSHHLAEGMKAFLEDAVHLQDEFPKNAEDADWLPTIGKRGWILVTRDERIRKNPAEIKAYRKHRVGAFFLGGKNRSRCELIRQLVRNWPRMKELSAKTPKPFAFRIPPKGTKFDRIPL